MRGPEVEQRVLELVLAGRGEEALAIVEATDETGPAIDGARGLALQVAGRLDEAIAAYRQAIDGVAMQLAGLEYNLGSALTAAGRLDEAAAAYEAAIGRAPGLDVARMNLGVVRQAQGRLDEAERIFREILSGAPDDVPTLLNLGAVLCAAEQPERFAEAAATFRRARELDPADARASAGLLAAEELHGAALAAADRLDEARAAFLRAAEVAPERPGPWNNLGVLATRAGDVDGAVAAYREALARDPASRAALAGLASTLHRASRHAEALEVFRRILAIDPDDTIAGHLAAAIAGETPPAPPPGYVASLFDGYAETFDRHLVESLGYRGPALLRAALGEERAARALDLGCGTGLVGAALRDRVDALEGVDASPRMVEAAAGKGLYDALACADLVEHLRAGGPPWDLIVAGDVLEYVGDLAPLFAAIRARLAPGGRFAFTLERDDGDSFRLQPSGRYAHSAPYVERLAAAHGLAVAHRSTAELRREDRQPVEALVFVLRGA